MDAATFAICRCDGPAVEHPTLCQKCGFTRFPGETGATAEAQVETVDLATAPPRRIFEPTFAPVETAEVVEPVAAVAAVAAVEPAAPPAPPRAAAPPPRAAAPPPRAPTPTPAPRVPTSPSPRPAPERTRVAVPEAAPEPARPKVVGHSVGRRSLWQSLHLSGRDGAHCAFALGAYVLVAMTFLAIGFRPMGPKAWAFSTFFVLQGLAALLVGAALYVNRRGLVAETERALLWITAPLLSCVAFNASVVTMHSTAGGVVATLFVVATAVVLHRKLARELGHGPGRALLVAATGLLATTGLAPLLGAFPPLVACAVAVLLWTGRVFVTKAPEAVAETGEGAEPASTRNGMVLETCALLLLSAFTATVSLTRGARYYGAAALPVWGMFLSSLVLVCKGWCASEEAVLPGWLRRSLDVVVDLGLAAGFALTFGDPVGMLVTGAIAGAGLLRDSLRRQRPLLVLPALAIFVAIYAYLPDPLSIGAQTLRSIVPARIAASTGSTSWSAYALYFAPWAIAMVGAATWLARRGHARHALFAGIWAALASGATCAGLLLGANRHPAMGVALTVVGVAIGASGLLTGRLAVVAAGSTALLYGVGASVLAAGRPHAAAELALALTVVGVLVTLGVVARGAAAAVATAVRRWIDGATLFTCVAIPVGLSAYRFRLPTETLTIANEFALGLLIFVLAGAWRRREATLAAAALFGRGCFALLALRAPGISAAQALQSFAAVSALPVVLWMAMSSLRLERRVDPAFRPGVLWVLLPVLAIQGFGAAEFGRGLVGIEHDPTALAITAVAVLAPIVAAVVAGVRLGAVRRAALAPSEA
jgi:hypothetical protein